MLMIEDNRLRTTQDKDLHDLETEIEMAPLAGCIVEAVKQAYWYGLDVVEIKLSKHSFRREASLIFFQR